MENEVIKEEIKFLISQKNNYMAAIIVLTGGIIGLALSELNFIKIFLVILGAIIDFNFISNNYNTTKRICNLLGVMKNAR